MPSGVSEIVRELRPEIRDEARKRCRPENVIGQLIGVEQQHDEAEQEDQRDQLAHVHTAAEHHRDPGPDDRDQRQPDVERLTVGRKENLGSVCLRTEPCIIEQGLRITQTSPTGARRRVLRTAGNHRIAVCETVAQLSGERITRTKRCRVLPIALCKDRPDGRDQDHEEHQGDEKSSQGRDPPGTGAQCRLM